MKADRLSKYYRKQYTNYKYILEYILEYEFQHPNVGSIKNQSQFNSSISIE